jgi:hypothetical protein
MVERQIVRTGSTHKEKNKCLHNFSGAYSEKRRHMENAGLDGRITSDTGE